MRPTRSVLLRLNLGGLALDFSPIVAIFALSIARSLLLLIIAGFVAPYLSDAIHKTLLL